MKMTRKSQYCGAERKRKIKLVAYFILSPKMHHHNNKYLPEVFDSTWKADGSSGSPGAAVTSSGHISVA